ncbi:MAG: hypothetical protein ACOYL3_15925 [Desulfuromonadaceae bacterium]
MEYPEGLVSHGICDECKADLLGPKKMSLMDFLDSLDTPVMVVDGEGNVQTANKLAREIIQKDLPDIEGFKGGDVFECAFAKLPAGCGNTVHCRECTIRNTVMNTMQTGISQLRSPAYLLQGTPDDNHEIKFLISTEIFSNVVLLRVDTVGEAMFSHGMISDCLAARYPDLKE